MSSEIAVANPFFSPKNPESTVYKYFKGFFVGVFIFPFRLVSLVVSLAFTFLLFKVSSLGLDHKPKTYFARWRELLLLPVPYLFRFMMFIAGFHTIKRTGIRETDPSIAPVIVSNHVSFWDGVVGGLDSSSKLPCYVSKKEALSNPIVGACLLSTRSILIDRANPDSRKKAKEDIVDAANRALNHQGPQVWIFPEGTTTNGESLISFKLGAFFPGLPVQPVCLKYPNNHSLAWCHNTSSIFHQIISPLFQFFNRMEITYLPVYHPNKEEKENPQLFANNVRKVMAKEMNVGVTGHGYEDVRLLVECQKNRENPHALDHVVFSEFNSLFSMKYDEMQELIRKFAQFDENKTGMLTRKGFSEFLSIPEESPVFADIFNMLDTDGDGDIDLDEFLRGLAALKKRNQDDEESIINAFNILDHDSKGFVIEKDFTEVMKNRSPSITSEKCHELFCSADTENVGRVTFEQFKKFQKSNPVYIEIAKNMRKRRLEKENEEKLRSEATGKLHLS